MAWGEIKRLAEHHRQMGWAGIILMTDEVLALEGELLGPVRALGQRMVLALLDHDLERLRVLVDQMARYGEER